MREMREFELDSRGRGPRKGKTLLRPFQKVNEGERHQAQS